jgi:hypothetical protein
MSSRWVHAGAALRISSARSPRGSSRTLRDASAHYAGGDEALLAAKVVGRWPDGTPLISSPDRPPVGASAAGPNGSAAAKAAANTFRYRDTDAGGMKCPLGAHIRRANPRDALGFEGRLSFRHRMIRRGMPYGEPLPPDLVEDDRAPRGLIFVISMLSYTAWHLGKPLPELWGTLVWGLLAGTIALASGTIWHLVAIHWLLNVLLDYAIYAEL